MKLEKKIGKVYLDFNATSPLNEELKKTLPEILEIGGNPSSIHWAGQAAKTLMRESRLKVAQAFGVSPLELIFTSGGSEANNTVLQGLFEKTKNSSRNEFITTNIEHPSVAKTLAHLKQKGAIVHVIRVFANGDLDWAHLQEVLGERTALVSMMFANNETGLLLPIRKVTEMAHTAGAKMHTDAVQALGKVSINLAELGVDFASFSAHKFYALKGCGVLYSKKGNDLPPLIYGGGQERHRRGGTENAIGIWAMGFMAERLVEIPERMVRVQALRDAMEQSIVSQIGDVQITQGQAARLSNTSSLVLEGVDGETLLMSLDVKGFAVSTGAACSAGSPEPSPTLLAMGLSREQAQSSLRVSLGWSTTSEEVDAFVETLVQVISRLRQLQQSSQNTPQEVAL